MLLLFGTVIINYAFYSIIVGLAAALIFSRCKNEISFFTAIPIIFITFILIDMIYVPVIFNLDIYFTVKNVEIAKLLELHPDYSLNEWISLEIIDVAMWVIQTVFAFAIGRRLQIRKT